MANVRIPSLPLTVLVDGTEFMEIAQSDGSGGYVSRRIALSTVNGIPSGYLAGPFVVASSYPLYPNSRVLEGTANNISVTDGGAGTDITLDLIATAVTPGTYGGSNKYTQITVDQYGRITAASEGADSGSGTVTQVDTGTGLSGGPITTTGTINFAVAAVGTWAATPSSANLLAAMTDKTGTGLLVFDTSPTFTTPVLGTPTSGTLTNCTGLPISTGVSGLGTGVATALAINVGTAGAVVVNGGDLGTPSSGTLTNCTGLPISTGVSGLGAGVATFLATPSSANLAAAVTDETGSGSLVFGTSPTFTTSIAVTTSAAGTIATFTSTDAGAAAAPVAVLDRNSASPAAADVLGQLTFSGRTTTAATVTYARITAGISDPANANPLGTLSLVATGPANTAAIDLTAATAPIVAISGLVDISGSLSGQIKFPATQNPSSNANTLDDYEEGTWTPTITFGGGSTGQTYQSNERNGTYIKIGSAVFYAARIRFSAKGSSTGSSGVSGFPFTSSTYGATSGSYAGSIWSVGAFTGLTGTLSFGVTGGGTTGTFRMSSATGDGVVADTFFTDTSAINIGGWYGV